MVQYDADRGSLSRFYAVESSPDRRQRLLQLQTDYLKQLQQLKFESLSTGAKADYLLFKRNMDEQLRLLQEEEQEYTQLSQWFSFAEKIYEIERIRRRGTQQDAQKLAATHEQPSPLRSTATRKNWIKRPVLRSTLAAGLLLLYGDYNPLSEV